MDAPTNTRVYVASPFSGDVERNTQYARKCMADSIMRGEAPFVPHLLYPQCLNDDNPNARQTGLAMAEAWLHQAEKLAVYRDHGVSEGMIGEIEAASDMGIPIEFRKLDK